MTILSPNVEAIKTTLDVMYSVEKRMGVTSVVETANRIIANFDFTPEEYHQIVDITKNKLQELLTGSGLISQDLGTLGLYPDGERTRKAVWFVNKNGRKVEMIDAQLITPDPEEMEKMHKFLADRRREYNYKSQKTIIDAGKNIYR